MRLKMIILFCTYMAGIFVSHIYFVATARADFLGSSLPTCGDPSSVYLAKRAYFEGDTAEIARLGCLIKMPDGIRVRALRCEPTSLEDSRGGFTYPVYPDATLPRGVCEIDVLWGGWRGTLYTYDFNIHR